MALKNSGEEASRGGKRDTNIAKSLISGRDLGRLIGEVWASIGAGRTAPPGHGRRDAQTKTGA
jgi:hypothetical protein